MKYYVTVGERDLEVELDGERVCIDGQELDARIDQLAQGDLYVLRLDDTVHTVNARRAPEGGRGRYEIGVDGYRFAIEALDERARAIRDLSRAVEHPSGPARLVAPMPGLVVRVSVSEGERVRAGQGLIVMEAMKMENELKAATAGVVRRVSVTPGSIVEKGALLLEVEATNEGN
ncbi:MAG TPA: acetyl-CoA carboxylase biotin carboxyl carrier protein subunit [Gemmatimonadaceae bacterium]|nr:acetyl-CoA carboxylase biotin carboxyl carrier protein subunit [Gemmatimonadaceae bacterium]